MPGPGDKNPEEQVEALIHDESMNTEELARGTEVYEEEIDPEEEEVVEELEFDEEEDDFEDNEVMSTTDDDDNLNHSGDEF